MRKSSEVLLSLIIPAFKQEKTIKKDLLKIKDVMDQLRYDFEIIVVVDGKLDRTYENAKKIRSSKIHVFTYQTNKGKGHAIRYGMAKSKGEIIAFIDAGMDIDPNGISMLLEHLKWYGADIIIGSKRHPVSKVNNYPLHRKIISFISQLYIRALFGLNVRDTQVGLKFMKRKVIKKILPRLMVKKYAFDIELLVVANYLGFKRIYEAPVELNWKSATGITSKNLLKVLLLTFWDTLAIYYRLAIRHYYDNRSIRNWNYDPELNFRISVR